MRVCGDVSCGLMSLCLCGDMSMHVCVCGAALCPCVCVCGDMSMHLCVCVCVVTWCALVSMHLCVCVSRYVHARVFVW